MSDVKSLDIGGNRCVRIGAYTLDADDGEPPQTRVFIAAGWASSPPLPVHSETVDVPESALPELVQALTAINREE